MSVRLKCFNASFDEGYQKLIDDFNNWENTHSPGVTSISWFTVEATKTLSLIAVYGNAAPQSAMVPVVMPPNFDPRKRH